MKVIAMGIFSSILSLFGWGDTVAQTENLVRAKQIRLTELNAELKLLEQHKTEFDFIGITSNGTDCIYFVKDSNKFQIEFEAMGKDQIPFIDKLKTFSVQNGYETQMTTYGNKPQYNSPEAPVLRILTNSDLEETSAIARKIQRDIFNNGDDTKYDVVP